MRRGSNSALASIKRPSLPTAEVPRQIAQPI